MKPKTLPLATMAAVIILALTITLPAAASVKPFINTASVFSDDKKSAAKSKKTSNSRSKSFSSLNNESVKIYPDVLKREMHVIAKDNDGKEVDFFVFDLHGTLLQHNKMKAGDHSRLSGMQRGAYIYRVFCGDEETAAGKFEIR